MEIVIELIVFYLKYSKKCHVSRLKCVTVIRKYI